MTSAKSLTKTAVLDASDKPEDQDEARKRRVKMDFASWRKQTKAGKTTHQEEVGISSAAAMEKARQEAKLRKKEQDAVRKEKEALKKEEVQVDEVYKKLPVAKMASKISKKQFKAGQSGNVKTISKKSTETGKMIGVLDTHDPERSKAKSKIKKEEVQLERALDTFEKGEKERVVKGMKKDTKGFKSRYGKRWKDVMYATATKKAKEAGDTSKSDKRYAYEAKVDSGDDVEKETKRNERKFGKQTFNQRGQTITRRRIHWSSRGDKKVKGAKEVQVEAKVDAGKTASEKSTARNQRNTPPGADKETDLKTFITRKPGESLDKARQRVRQGQHAARRGVKEEKIDELNRYEKETGKSSGPAGSYRGGVNTPSKGTPTKKGGSSDKLVHFGKGLKRSAEGRPTGQTRKSYDDRGKEGNTPTPVEKIKKYLDAKRAAKADPSQGRYPPGSRKD